ncbi:MAG: ion transporter [Planctomycetaceae bacterium]
MTLSSNSQRPEPSRSYADEPGEGAFRERLWRIVFRSDTFAGRLFDVVLLALIVVCVVVVMLESVESLRAQHSRLFRILEWSFTAIFTVEYLTRLWLVRDRWRYATSFFGIIDLISILPSYLELLLAGSHYLMTVRILRLLRMFRILRMTEHVDESQVLLRALRASREKIIVFLVSVVALVCVEGTMMYVLEQGVNGGFANIPQSIYWAVVTITTVGFGDVTPVTVAGKLMACVIMLTGFAIIAVPTGVVTSEMHREITQSKRARKLCLQCGWAWHDIRARFCQQCGERLPDE